MAQPSRPPAPASPPASSGGEDPSNQFLLSGKFIAVLFLAALILAALTLFADIFGQLSLIVLALAICALCYRLRLAMRILICALVLVGISLYVARPMLSETFYDVGLAVLSSYGDPGERGFWPDPAKMDLPDTVVTEVPYGDGLEGFNTTTDEGRAGAIAGLKYEYGARYLEYAAGALLFSGLVIACLGTALRLLGITKEPVPTSVSATPGLFSRIPRSVRAGLALVAIGWVLFLVGGLGQEMINSAFERSTGTYGGTGYLRGEGVLLQAQHLFWPMMFLDKVHFMGGALIWVGISFSVLPLIGRVWRWVRSTRDPFRVLGFSLVVIGVLIGVFSLTVLPGLIIPMIQEIAAQLGNFTLLSGSNYPGWLSACISIMNHLGPICIIAGIVLVIFGKYTLPLLGGLIAAYFSSWFDPPGRPSGGDSSTSSGASSQQPTFSGGGGPPPRSGGRGGRGGGR